MYIYHGSDSCAQNQVGFCKISMSHGMVIVMEKIIKIIMMIVYTSVIITIVI